MPVWLVSEKKVLGGEDFIVIGSRVVEVVLIYIQLKQWAFPS